MLPATSLAVAVSVQTPSSRPSSASDERAGAALDDPDDAPVRRGDAARQRALTGDRPARRPRRAAGVLLGAEHRGSGGLPVQDVGAGGGRGVAGVVGGDDLQHVAAVGLAVERGGEGLRARQRRRDAGDLAGGGVRGGEGPLRRGAGALGRGDGGEDRRVGGDGVEQVGVAGLRARAARTGLHDLQLPRPVLGQRRRGAVGTGHRRRPGGTDQGARGRGAQHRPGPGDGGVVPGADRPADRELARLGQVEQVAERTAGRPGAVLVGEHDLEHVDALEQRQGHRQRAGAGAEVAHDGPVGVEQPAGGHGVGGLGPGPHDVDPGGRGEHDVRARREQPEPVGPTGGGGAGAAGAGQCDRECVVALDRWQHRGGGTGVAGQGRGCGLDGAGRGGVGGLGPRPGDGGAQAAGGLRGEHRRARRGHRVGGHRGRGGGVRVRRRAGVGRGVGVRREAGVRGGAGVGQDVDRGGVRRRGDDGVDRAAGRLLRQRRAPAREQQARRQGREQRGEGRRPAASWLHPAHPAPCPRTAGPADPDETGQSGAVRLPRQVGGGA